MDVTDITTAATAANIVPGAKYQVHPLAEKFDPMDGTDFDALVADIKANGFTGLIGSIVLFEDKILDGRNRYLACLKAEVEPKVEIFTGTHEEAKAFVISANLRRRHLSADRKRELIEELLKKNPGKSDRMLAGEAGASPTTVGKVRKKVEATVQGGQLEKVEASTGKSGQSKKRVGKDGKSRKVAAKAKTDKPKKTAGTKTKQPLDSIAFCDADLTARQKYFDKIPLKKVLEALPPAWRPHVIAWVKSPDDMPKEFFDKLTYNHLSKELVKAVLREYGKFPSDEKLDRFVASLKSDTAPIDPATTPDAADPPKPSQMN